MRIATVDAIRLYLYPNDHNPPHFHALYAEYEAVIDIRTLEVLEGSLPRKQLKQVMEWVEGKQDLLLNEFVRLQKSK